jgi:hypothetical protein
MQIPNITSYVQSGGIAAVAVALCFTYAELRQVARKLDEVDARLRQFEIELAKWAKWNRSGLP